MTTDTPRTYKHQISADDFIFAFTATEAEFATRADELRNKGVERLTGDQAHEHLVVEQIESLLYYGISRFTYLTDVEIQGYENEMHVHIANINRSVPHLFLLRCKLPSLTIEKCTLIDCESYNHAGIDIHVVDSTIGNLWIHEDSMMGNFYFNENSILGNLYINENSTTGDFNFSERSGMGNFMLSGTSTTGSLFFYKESVAGSFVITESSTMGEFRISGASTTGEFRISKTSVTGSFWIKNKSLTGDFWIMHSSTTGEFLIENKSTTGDFRIDGASTTGDFRIDGKSTTGYFWISEVSTIGDFRIIDSQCSGFEANDLYASFFLLSATIPQCRLTNCHIPKLEILSGCKLEVYITESKINLIDFRHLTLSKDSAVSFFDCGVYACLMEEFAMLGQLYMRQLKPLAQPFTWYDPALRVGENSSKAMLTQLQEYQTNYINKHLVELKGTENQQHTILQPTFRIAQSSLGKTEFTNCDLGGFQFEFSNSKITEVFMSGGTVPQSNIVIHGEEPDTLAWEEQKVSVYNQLKKIFDGQGDVYWATTFQAKTAEHQEKLLQLRRQDETAWFSTTFWDLKTFQLNRWSNLHGESWGRALVFTLGAGGFFYLLFLWFIGKLFQPTAIDWSLAGQYFLFLDPTHKPNFGEKGDLGFWAYAADFVGRIFVGYGIFQFIAAFRKHGKK